MRESPISAASKRFLDSVQIAHAPALMDIDAKAVSSGGRLTVEAGEMAAYVLSSAMECTPGSGDTACR